MPDQGSRTNPAFVFYGVVARATEERLPTQDIYARIRADAEERGLPLPPNIFQAVNEMRATAAGIREASARLERAPDQYALTSEVIAPAIYARDPGSRELAPQWHVRYDLTTTRAGITETNTYALHYSGTLPATIGDLRADVETVASDLADSYGVSFSGISNLEVTEF